MTVRVPQPPRPRDAMIAPVLRPALIVMSGLPGTGKTTISQRIAGALGAAYLRIDTIEVALGAAGLQPVGAAGYALACAIAASNLAISVPVVADGVNPVRESRAAWRDVAAGAAAILVDIHLVCTDRAEHRRRVETRTPDIAGHRLPNWDDVMRLAFEPHTDAHLVLDTAAMTVDEAVTGIMGSIAHRRRTGGMKDVLS